MKHNYTAWRFLDPAPTEGTGGPVLDAIQKNHKATTDQIDALKSAQEKALSDAQKLINEKLADADTRVGEAKAATQSLQDKITEMEQKMTTYVTFGKNNSQPRLFKDVLNEAIEKHTDDIVKMSKGDKTVKHISIPIDIKAVGDITVGNVTGGTVYGSVYRPGIIELPKRKVHLRNVLPGGNIGPGTDFYFMRQNGTGEGSIAFTAETGTKPQFDDDLVEASVKIETLAGWQRITRKAMNNVPGFMQFLNSRMVEKLLKAEDAGILYGDGVSPNIKGILTSGNFTASTSTATILAEKIIDDIAALEDTYEREANIIMLRPQHYYGFFKNKAAGSGEYDLPQNVVITNGQLYISGILAVPTTALNINTAPTPDDADYVVGDVNGAAFLVQESMRIEIFEQDGTNVRENKITVRIEETCALPVYGSNYFIKGTQAVTI
jgi:HK97 family phage major capsid protein